MRPTKVLAAFLLLALVLVVHPAWAKRRPQPAARASGSIAVAAIVDRAVTFDVTVVDLAPGEYPYVWVRCFSGETWVYQKVGSPAATFYISAGSSCLATLNVGTNNETQRVTSEEVASVAFDVP